MKSRHQYLTKRRLISAARSGIIAASAETMAIMGCNVIAEGGWVVKKFADGRVVRISRISAPRGLKRSGIILD